MTNEIESGSMNHANCEHRVFQFLFNSEDGLLRRYSAPEDLAPTRRREEIEAMARQMCHDLRDPFPRDQLERILTECRGEVERRHGTRKWPTIKLLSSCMGYAAETVSKQHTSKESVEENMLRMLTDWWLKRKRQAPGIGKPHRTRVLISRGVLTLAEARAHSFDMDSELMKQARKEANGEESK